MPRTCYGLIPPGYNVNRYIKPDSWLFAAGCDSVTPVAARFQSKRCQVWEQFHRVPSQLLIWLIPNFILFTDALSTPKTKANVDIEVLFLIFCGHWTLMYAQLVPCFGLLVMSAPSFTCILCHLHTIDSLDPPLVQHLGPLGR